MILLYSLKSLFIVKDKMLEVNVWSNEPRFNPVKIPVKSYLFRKLIYFSKKQPKNIIFFLDYNQFVHHYTNHQNYLIEYYDIKQLYEYKNMNFNRSGIRNSDFTQDTKVVLLSNHGYVKDFNFLLVFDVQLSSTVQMEHREYSENYQFDGYQTIFVFYGLLLLSERLEFLSIIYLHDINAVMETREHYIFLLERNTLINLVLEAINLNDNVSSILKQYFLNYKQIINDLISNKEIYTLEDKYELDNFPYSNFYTIELYDSTYITLQEKKYLLQNYNEIGGSYSDLNPYSYLKYYMVILSSKAITNIITPKELSNAIFAISTNKNKKVSKVNTINFYGDVMFFVDREDSILVISKGNIYKKIKPVKKMNTKKLLATVLKKQCENLHLFFPEIEYEVYNLYTDPYNWKYVFYFKSQGKHDIRLDYTTNDYFYVLILKEVFIKIFNHNFSSMFIKYSIKLRNDEIVAKKYMYLNLGIYKNQCIIFSDTYLDVLPDHYINFFIEEEDVKKINDFISYNTDKYYKGYDPIFSPYAYGGYFRLKVILITIVSDSDINNMSSASIKFQKNGVTYVAFPIIYRQVTTNKNVVINDNYRLVKFFEYRDNDEYRSYATKIILLMKNEDYISRRINIERFRPDTGNSVIELFVSIAIPENRFNKIIEDFKLKRSINKKITIEGIFLINSVGNTIYLNGFVEKIKTKNI